MELETIELKGTPTQMGGAFGEACREEIRELHERRLRSAVQFAATWGDRSISAAQVTAVAESCLPFAEAYDPAGYEEFAAIAAGADMTPADLFVMQGLTDMRDLLAFGEVDGGECTAAIIPRERAQGARLLMAQNWDLETYNMPFVRLVHRRPETGPATWSLTLTGCLSLIGVNSEGVAVGNTNLRTTDGRRGVHYLQVLHRALACTSFEDALEAIRSAPRLSGHYYYLGFRDGRATGVECSGQRSVLHPARERPLVHTNHATAAAIRAVEAPDPGDSSRARLRRLESLVDRHTDPIGIQDLKVMLSDHEGGNNAICRHNAPPVGVSTNACVVLSPETREIHACRGQPHVGRFLTRGLPY